MVTAEVTLKCILPGAANLRREIEALLHSSFALTAFDDSLLRLASGFLPEDGDTRVLSFGDVIARSAGCAEMPLLRLPTRGQVRTSIALACRELGTDSPFAASGGFRGTHAQLERAIDMLRHWGLRPEQVTAYAESTPNSVGPRLSDLGRIFADVEERLARIGREFATSQALRLFDQVPKHPIPFRRLAVIVGTSAPPVYIRTLVWLVQNGVPVTVLARFAPGSSASEHRIEMLAKLLDAIPENRPTIDVPIQKLFPTPAPQVSITSASDRLAECEWALRMALDEGQRGVLAHRMVVFVRDAEGYAPLIHSAAQRLGMPVYAPVRTPLLANGFALLTLKLLGALSWKDPRGLLPLLGSSYLPLSRQQRSELRLGIIEETGSIDEPWRWLTSHATTEGPEWLQKAVAWRFRAHSIMVSLSEWHGLLRALVDETGLAERIADPDSETQARDLRASTAMLRAIADYASVVEESTSTIDLPGFVKTCVHLWECEDVVLPHSGYGITLCSNIDSIPEVDVLFVLGMLEGTLPKRRREGTILRDADLEALNTLPELLAPLPTSREIAMGEREVFLSLCGAATQCVTWSYPRTTEDSDNIPAFYLTEVRRELGERLTEIDHLTHELAPEASECKTPADLRLRNALAVQPIALSTPMLRSDRAQDVVRPQPDEPIAVDELARTLVCPFQSAFRHRLKLFDENAPLSMGLLRKVPVRAGLAQADSKKVAEQALNVEIKLATDRSAKENEPWETALIESASNRLVQEWVEREFAARALWPRIEHERFNVPLDTLRNEIAVGGRTIRFDSTVPALGQVGDFSVIRLFESRIPNKDSFTTDPPHPDLLRYGLLLLAQYKMAEGVGLEIDGMNGKRMLYLAGPAQPPSQNVELGLERHVLSEDLKPLFERIKSALRIAVETLHATAMKPSPGTHCSFCAYGDLCRVSAEFNQTVGASLAPSDEAE